MKRETFNLGFAVLINAFSYVADRLSEETQEIYWQDLKDIPDGKFQEGVAWCRHHGDFFPSIAKLGAACYDNDTYWHERLVQKKRLAFDRAMKKLEPPPISDEEKLKNRQILAEIARNLGKKMDLNGS